MELVKRQNLEIKTLKDQLLKKQEQEEEAVQLLREAKQQQESEDEEDEDFYPLKESVEIPKGTPLVPKAIQVSVKAKQPRSK